VHLRRARSAALAALAAAVLDLNTANAWATYAHHDWSAYLAARTLKTSDRIPDPS
jgi:hypothetical protein